MIIYPTLYIMVGIPGSGKSTAAKNHSEIYKAIIFSSDEYRKKLLGNEFDQSNNNLIFKELYADIADNLRIGNNCILDATNINIKDRKKAFDSIDSILRNKFNFKYGFHYRKIAIVCLAGVSICIERDAKRERSVGEQVIKKFVSKFEYPQIFEGFDDIYNVADINTYGYYDRAEFFSRMSGFNQNSKYHKYDLLTHSLLLAESFDDDVRHEAGLFHDIGKTCTETRDEEGYSHYYQHANWSAYLVACNMGILKQRFSTSARDIIFYINQHMHIRDIVKSEKAIEKYKKLWGEERFNKLIEFMNNDNKASGRNFNE